MKKVNMEVNAKHVKVVRSATLKADGVHATPHNMVRTVV